MKIFLASLLPFALTVTVLSSCKSDEEILPKPPASHEPAAPAVTEVNEKRLIFSVDTQSDSFEYVTHQGISYRVLFPANYDSSKQYPMLLFLHGIGERGTDNERQLAIGGSYFRADSVRERYHSFVIYPQCPENNYWTDGEITEKLKAFIDSFQQEFAVDDTKVSIGGFSMGAYGTFEMVSRYPGFFEAAFAIAGAGDERKASQMAASRWRIFAGAGDNVVPAAKSQIMAQALADAGASVSFTSFPGVDHGTAWVHALSEPDFFHWLFLQDQGPSRQEVMKQ